MAFGYNNYNYPGVFPPQGYQSQSFPQSLGAPQPPQNSQNIGNGAIWVQGEAGAKSYIVAAGNTVILWDSEKINSEKPVIYIKSADAQGVPSMQAFELVAIDNNQTTSSVNYVTREEFETMRHNVETLLERENERQARYEQKQRRNNINNTKVKENHNG